MRKRASSETRALRAVRLPHAAASLGALSFSAMAHADPPANHFTWERGVGAEACLSEPELRSRIVEMLGTDPFAESRAPVVRGVVARRGDQLVATVRLTEAESGSETAREFQVSSADCTPLTNAVALALTLALEAQARRSEAPSDSTAPAGSDRGVVAPAKPGTPGPWAALAEASWTLGVLPRPVAGLGVELRYAVLPRFGVAFGGDWLPRASEGGQFSVGLARARVGLCVVPFLERSFSILACGSAEGGALSVQNESASLASAGAHPWFGAGLTARASAHVGARWVVEGGAGAVIPTIRPVYATPSCPLLGFQEPAATLTVLVSTGVLF